MSDCGLAMSPPYRCDSGGVVMFFLAWCWITSLRFTFHAVGGCR